MNRSNQVRLRQFNTRADRDGFTLIELVVSILAASMLLVGLSSALYISIQATEPNIGGHESQLHAGQTLADLTSELRFAQTFLERSSNAVEFTVADRDNDSISETIRWEWSGVAGDPLTRQINGGPLVNVLENVHDFNLAYNIDEVTTIETGAGESTSDEFLLANFEGWEGVSADVGSYSLGDANWAAEYFVAQGLPAELTSMAITKVSLRLSAFLGGTVQVTIHKAIGGGNVEPMQTAVGSIASVETATLPSGMNWVDIDFSDVTLDELHSEFVIVVKALSSNTAFAEFHNDRAAPADSTVMLKSSNAGASWDPAASKRDENDMLFRAYGTYTLASGGETEVTRSFVTSTAASIQIGADSQYQRSSTTEILNRPEILQP
jgi:prepilin-type N-terminal cleavage/methylation domain-containing protein